MMQTSYSIASLGSEFSALADMQRTPGETCSNNNVA